VGAVVGATLDAAELDAGGCVGAGALVAGTGVGGGGTGVAVGAGAHAVNATTASATNKNQTKIFVFTSPPSHFIFDRRLPIVNLLFCSTSPPISNL
jgi:hypothetical protein